jgi:hypothetical protein
LAAQPSTEPWGEDPKMAKLKRAISELAGESSSAPSVLEAVVGEAGEEAFSKDCIAEVQSERKRVLQLE